jgi:uncharacterized protein (TIGR00251 family)
MDKKSFYKWQENNLQLELYVRPRTSKNAVVGPYGEHLKITITAPPVEGKANNHLIKFLAKYFGINQNQVKILKGANSKYKSVLVSNPKNNLVEFKK